MLEIKIILNDPKKRERYERFLIFGEKEDRCKIAGKIASLFNELYVTAAINREDESIVLSFECEESEQDQLAKEYFEETKRGLRQKENNGTSKKCRR